MNTNLKKIDQDRRIIDRKASYTYFKNIFSVFVLFAFFIVGCGDADSGDEAKEEVLSAPRFSLLSAFDTGINFINKVPETKGVNLIVYQYLHNGAGVSVGDINNDGLPDIYLTTNFGDNHLYLNKGNLKFEEIAKQAGAVGDWGWTTGSTMVDINNDGYLDIYISKSGDAAAGKRKNELLINNGDLTFTNKAGAYGLDDEAYSSQAAFFDYDKDGDLDMYLLNHPIIPVANVGPNAAKERDPYTSDKLYRNDKGRFVDVSEEAGLVGNGYGYGLSVSTGDLNNDGWTDIYVANDYAEHDYLYMNNADGTFSEKLKEKVRHISNFSMGSDIADFNNDGLLDLMVVDMVAEDNYRIKTNMSGMSTEKFHKAVNDGLHYQYMMNTLQMNNGNGTFSEVSQLAGLSSTDWSWAPLWADFDNDGLKDLLVTNGLRKEARNVDFVNKKKKLLEEMNKNPGQHFQYIKMILDEMPEVRIQNYIFKNEGDISFSNKRDEWGLKETSYSNGAAYADLDNDGDLDIIISNIDHNAFIYRNNTEQAKGGNYLKLKLKGNGENLSGLGTRVTIKSGDDFQMKEHFLNRGYLSSMEDNLHFGLGKKKNVDTLWVEWPDGNIQVLSDVSANKTLELSYEKSKNKHFASLYKKSSNRLMEEVGDQLNLDYKHQENIYNDFERETLLPHKLSTLGPAMVVADLNGDGLDDFYVGGAKGFSGKLFIQSEEGQFVSQSQSTWQQDRNSEDVAATVLDSDNDGDLDLYVVSGGSEYNPNSKELQDRLYLNDGSGNFTKSFNALPDMITSGGTVNAADYDADGDMDLFVGGRLIPGQYPKAPRSYLLNNNNGKFEDVTESVAPDLKAPGLITSCLWSDYDGDGQLDLIIAGEWTPISVFKNNGGKFTSTTESLGLSNTQGWWYSMAEGDFDNDGDQDFVFGNLGLNYKYRASQEEAFDIYYDDFDNNKTGDIVLTFNENGEKFPLRGRECSSQQMPFIKEKFGTYDEFAKANMNEVFGKEKLNNALHLEAKTFASVLVENKGNDKWDIRILPRLAQLSSVNGIVAEDVDSDGNLDIILAGNMYHSEVETPRNDAANGLVLKGDGKGKFRSMSVTQSNLYAPGDVKSVHLINIKNRPHLIVVNNNDTLQFFRMSSGG